MTRMSDRRTPSDWDNDPRNGIRILSWSDFGRAAAADGVNHHTAITWEAFRRYRRAATVQVKPGRTWLDADGITPH